MENETKSKIMHSFSNNSMNIKNRKELRIKLTKLANSYFNPRCEHFINNIRSLNFRILESSGGKKSIDKEVKESRNFRFGKNKDYFVHFTDLSPYKIEFTPFIKNLKKQFTNEEINIIKKNKDYYVQNEIIKDNLSIFNDQSLYQVLNKEEREEEIKKEKKKKFHDLNYFNNRRKNTFLQHNNSNVNMSNNSSTTINNNSLNKINKNDKIKNSILPFYQTSDNGQAINEKKLTSIEQKNIITYNLENLSHFYVKKNKLDVIEKEIRKGVKKMKKEDEKLNLINEKRNKIFTDMAKKSQIEIKKLLDTQNGYNYPNEMNWFKKRQRQRNRKKTNLPTINNAARTLSKVKISAQLSNDFLESPSGNSKHFLNLNSIKKNKENRYQISLYSQRNNSLSKEYIKKKEENEELFIKDIHRRIKSIYDSFKYNHNHNK